MPWKLKRNIENSSETILIRLKERDEKQYKQEWIFSHIHNTYHLKFGQMATFLFEDVGKLQYDFTIG